MEPSEELLLKRVTGPLGDQLQPPPSSRHMDAAVLSGIRVEDQYCEAVLMGS